MWRTNNNTKRGANGDGGYLVVGGIQQCKGPLAHYLHVNGDGGSTSPKHMQHDSNQQHKKTMQRNNKGIQMVFWNQ